MKNKLLASTAIALALANGSALAADLPARKGPPPVYAPPPVWTGFYLGVNAGYTWSNSPAIRQSYFDTGAGGFGPLGASGALPNEADLANAGLAGGGQIGYNYQFSNNFVAGLEADVQAFAGSSGTTQSNSALTLMTATKSTDYVGTVRGRVGYLVIPTLLVYGSAGLAYGQGAMSLNYVRASKTAPLLATDSYSGSHVGWTAGAGGEWMFRQDWSVKAEYLYYNLGSATTPGAVFAYTPVGGAPQISTAQSSTRFDGHIFRAGVNYHFNFAAPAPVVIAKY